MSKDAVRPPLSRPLKVAEIEEGTEASIEATRQEIAAIIALLDLLALEGLSFDYRLDRGGGGRLRLSGRLKARVSQTCVVSLEPVETEIDMPVEAEFWPAPLIEQLERQAESAGQSGAFDWPEPIIDETIDLGPIVYETLATALDPYPKREGAQLEWRQEPEKSAKDQSGPFAALKQLKEG